MTAARARAVATGSVATGMPDWADWTAHVHRIGEGVGGTIGAGVRSVSQVRWRSVVGAVRAAGGGRVVRAGMVCGGGVFAAARVLAGIGVVLRAGGVIAGTAIAVAVVPGIAGSVAAGIAGAGRVVAAPLIVGRRIVALIVCACVRGVLRRMLRLRWPRRRIRWSVGGGGRFTRSRPVGAGTATRLRPVAGMCWPTRGLRTLVARRSCIGGSRCALRWAGMLSRSVPAGPHRGVIGPGRIGWSTQSARCTPG